MPTTLASDDFNRAGPALGATWDANTGDGLPNGFSISSNRAVPGDVNNDVSSTFNGITWPNDYAITVSFTATAANGAGSGCGCISRSVTTGQTYYRVVGNADGYSLVKAVAGAYTTLSGNTGTTFTAADTLTLEFQGSTWRLRKNGVQFATGTDGAIGSGRGGIGYSSFDTGTTIDNFLVEDVPAVLAPPPPARRMNVGAMMQH